VRRPFRRFGLGRVIAETLIDRAREAGYSTMLLDTLDDMESARELYASLGFSEVPPYYYNPIPGAHYLKADLDDLTTRY
jgi:GNAT superfamily N-acetyltransferase